MLHSIFKRNIDGDFVVIDSQFPQKDPSAFRNAEINEYLSKIKNFETYTMYFMKPDSTAWFGHGYGMTREEFIENKEGYLKYYPQNKLKIHYLEKNRRYRFKLAYSYFLAETYTLV